MKTYRVTHLGRWIALILMLVVLGGGGYYVKTHTTYLDRFWGNSSVQTAASTTSSLATVAIEPADLAQTAVSAAGNLALVNEREVALEVDGIVREIEVEVGDTVKAGETLLKLDTVDLERAVAQAKLNTEAAQIALNELKTPATEAELAKAEAALTEAQENLADVQAGPSAEEVAAARSALAAAQASYSELQAGPSDAELTQLSAELKKAEVAVAEAQRAYDKVSWRNDVGMTSESAALQDATITYEAAEAAYEQSTAAASTSEVQSAVSTIKSAQSQLNDLLNSPTTAELATAEAQVTDAQAALAELKQGVTDNELRSAEITLQQALINLESAYRDLAAATVTAPTSGVVMSLDAEVGVRSSADHVVATLADPNQLELVVSVAEADIPSVAVGQAAEIEIDALPGQSFTGVVEAVAPTNDSSSSSVSYPVTVRLNDPSVTSVLPGMNAVATLASLQSIPDNSWLVPTNAIVKNGDMSTVSIVRGTNTLTITVAPGKVQGEWTMVQSTELQEGDQAVGSVTSNQDSSSTGPGGEGGPPPGGMGPMGG
ncbi:MAG: efflux RND transporter periplasmic adaptor subunit [Caldilineaceae bacterium]